MTQPALIEFSVERRPVTRKWLVSYRYFGVWSERDSLTLQFLYWVVLMRAWKASTQRHLMRAQLLEHPSGIFSVLFDSLEEVAAFQNDVSGAIARNAQFIEWPTTNSDEEGV